MTPHQKRQMVQAHKQQDEEWSAMLRFLLLMLFLSLFVGILAYQAPPQGSVAVGWFGDQLFLNSNEGLGQDAVERGEFYADEFMPESPTTRSRWTRQHAVVILPNLGYGTNLQVTLLAQGWPDDAVGMTGAQPLVNVGVDGRIIGSFQPENEWKEHTFLVPAAVQTGADFRLSLETSMTFTDTEQGRDARPKGIRLAQVRVQAPSTDLPAIVPPAWEAVRLLMIVSLLVYALLIRLIGQGSAAFVSAIVCAGLIGVGLAMLRIWMGAALYVASWMLVVALILSWQKPLLDLLRALVRRYSLGRALGYGLVTAALAWLGYGLARFSMRLQLPGLRTVWENFPDALMYGLLSTGLLALSFVLGRQGLPLMANGIVDSINQRRGARIVMLGFCVVWLGYQVIVISDLPYVGHADYADNAVVARNLVAGRGWVVDYVTQFYKLYDDITRAQETWPLLQPVWIAPFIALFGPEAWAVKLPNLIFNAILIVMIYTIGFRLWDRRVGIVAACITLTTEWFFKLTIFATSDLAFVVFSMGALYLLYQATLNKGQYNKDQAKPLFKQYGAFLGSGMLTGLMILQKPSGAMIALGMGIWFMQLWIVKGRHWIFRDQPGIVNRKAQWGQLVIWGVIILVIITPYIARNIILFKKPVYSTESYDAWILGYRGMSEEAWDDIYRVYAPELGGQGLPGRHWILRWGFDRTIAKFFNQLQALRDYFMPALAGLPPPLEGFSSRLDDDKSKNLLTPLGAWLSCIGIVTALRSRRRLLSLLLFAFGPYMLFMATYWHTDEERYWVMLIPWLALLVAWMVWSGFDRLATIGDGRWSPLGFILVCVAIGSMIQPWWPGIAEQVKVTPQKWAPDLRAYEWISRNTPPNTVVMTRIPWQFHWHTERPAVMIPNTADRDLLLQLAQHYNAEYLALENQLRVKGDSAVTLKALLNPGEAQVGDIVDGFLLVYASPTPDNRAFIYRFPKAVTP